MGPAGVAAKRGAFVRYSLRRGVGMAGLASGLGEPGIPCMRSARRAFGGVWSVGRSHPPRGSGLGSGASSGIRRMPRCGQAAADAKVPPGAQAAARRSLRRSVSARCHVGPEPVEWGPDRARLGDDLPKELLDHACRMGGLVRRTASGDTEAAGERLVATAGPAPARMVRPTVQVQVGPHEIVNVISFP
jgi:hypothetical protein